MKEKATIFDYARMCESAQNCDDCPLGISHTGWEHSCDYMIRTYPDKANEIILNWCKEHPVETRHDRLLKIFPNVLIKYGQVDICPEKFDMDFRKSVKCDDYTNCCKCKKDYWLAEVEE